MRFFFTIFFILIHVHAKPQTGFAFNHITSEDGIGLNSDVVYTTYQDEKGFIWAGTSNGLQRFDGAKFISFSSAIEKGQLPVSDLVKIISVKKNELWLHFQNRGEVGLFNTVTFQYRQVNIQPARSLPVRREVKLWRDSKGGVYLSVWMYGILKYNAQKDAFFDFDGFQLPKGWLPTAYLFEDTMTQRFWFPCGDSGLAMHDAVTGKTYTQKFNPIQHPILKRYAQQPSASEIYIDSKRRYWIFHWDTGHHRLCYAENGTILKDTAGLSENDGYQELRHFFESRRKGLWMYGPNSLYHYDYDLNRFFFSRGSSRQVDAVQYGVVYEMKEDRDGGIWLATDNGLYFLNGGKSNWDVKNYFLGARDGTGYEITDILQLQTGEYWLSSWGKGILSLTKKFQRYDAGVYSGMPSFDRTGNAQYLQTWTLCQQADGRIWIGCQAGKYILHNPVTKTSTFHQLNEAENATIRFITAGKDNSLWIGTQRGHVIKYDGKKFTTLQKLNTIIRKIFVDKQGLVWVALEGDGLYCLNETGEKIIHHFAAGNNDGTHLFQNNAYDIEQLNDSVIICAAGAMNFIHKTTGKVKWLTVEDGLPGNTLMRIRRDQMGYMWMISANGLCRYNPVNHRITPYGRKDAVMIAKITKEADYLSADNYLMFAGGSNLLVFKSGDDESENRPPDVLITDFKLFSNYLPVDSLLQLPYVRLKSDQHSFTINFSSLSYLQREKLVYYYRMKGIGDEWIKADGAGSVNFTLLPAGKYTFEVYAENIDGLRSKNIASVSIHIQPPFWRTAWFLSTLLTMVAIIAYSMHRLRIKRILAVEKIRNRVARDLHDDMGSTLSTINILSSMAKAKLNSDLQKTCEYINKISDNSQRMMEAMDDIVWAIKPANDSMHKVVGRMREFATNVFEAKDIDLEFKADDAVNHVNINMEARRDFFLIFKEAVNNAAKYSRCDKAVVEVYVDHHKLILQVKDNGIGFDVKTADGGNGLGNMQKRADALSGKIQIQSSAGEGTKVTLTVPLN
jgi:signal transduction histidine kinase/ligand-binding sensor domain-containing protein